MRNARLNQAESHSSVLPAPRWLGVSRVFGSLAAPLLFCLLTALAAQVRVPLPGTPVPMTLQLAAVLLGGMLLAPWGAGSAMLLYLGLGAAGVPVFAAGTGGLAGPTAGYLVAFPICATLVSLLRGSPRSSWRRLSVAAAFGVIVVLSTGTLWLAVMCGDWSSALSLGFLPFLLKGVLESAVAVAAAVCWHQSNLNRNGSKYGV